MTDRMLQRVPFHDPVRANKILQNIIEAFLGSGTRYQHGEFIDALTAQLETSADPDLALTSLLRFAEASTSKTTLFTDFVQYPVLANVLVTIFSHSGYFADILVRDPELFRWLTSTDVLTRERTKEYYAIEASRILAMFKSPERALNALRRLYRREVLRIGVRDILEHASIEQTTRELSGLADALVQAACVLAESQLASRFPEPPATTYAVIGLGKLGGEELNYSSDIDIMLVYGEEGVVATGRGGSATYLEYFIKLVEYLVHNLSVSTGEGHMYRVDLRLRPEGRVGPLARSLAGCLLYYESRGELWERQMLIKARCIAGDTAVGKRFLSQIQPFVYPKTFFQHPAEIVARIKARIESVIAGEENVKLRAGGIRDIEFAVQTLQLVNGGRVASVREGNTLRAIDLLAEHGLLSTGEALDLREAYIFFRMLEHRLQMMLNLQTHVLPSGPGELHTLARRMGFPGRDDLQQRYASHLEKVRRVYESVLSADAGARDVPFSLDEFSTEPALKQLGFSDPRKAWKHLQSLSKGSTRSRLAFEKIGRDVLHEIAETPIPDMTLANLTTLVLAQRFPEQVYSQMQQQGYRRLVLDICAKSPRVVKALAARPLLLERIVTGNIASSRVRQKVSVPVARLEGEALGLSTYLLAQSSFAELTKELAALADHLVVSVSKAKERQLRMARAPLAVFALGKYGSREISVDADLDVFFVCETRSGAAKAKVERLATEIVNGLAAVSAEGKGYDVDARLRPEGKNAPLVVERKAYQEYLAGRSSLWERQSLTRLRFISGDGKLAARVLEYVKGYVYDTPLPPGWIEQILAMRRKMEGRGGFHGDDAIDLKTGAGGMVDVEFLAQMFLLYSGTKGRILHCLPTADILENIPDHLLSSSRRNALAAHYRMLREIETLIKIALEDRSLLLPRAEKLNVLAKLFDRSNGKQFEERLREGMILARRTFLEFAERLKS